MTITYTNRKGFTYLLNKGVTKTGKPRYYFAREQKDEPVDALPAGYEIEESVNGVVSLVKSRPRIISLEEVAAVQAALDEHLNAQNYRLAVKRDHIEFTPDGRWLIGSGPEQPILLWHVQFDELVHLACETVGRNLTQSEWA
jgi:hypothetical protein